ncbi:DUF5412 family protein [Sporosarcina jeotgali]|uniref:DUF5412 family protein n=1 Tax=Sporosarcina jeotgali TaxID=3020056 RepID=A0ABZ0KUK9_9BACL|nr:DUF5412 family protein [Sporosarcina sp. B2O-1]WOV83645.1 DUF5412 family protein [Sporosarcina sp. B2O-1]
MVGFIKKRPVISFLAALAILFLCLGSYIVNWAFYDIERVSKDELLIESTSPNGSYTINLYKSKNGATVKDGIIGELVFNEKDKKSKNIYWDMEEHAAVEWIDDRLVTINGHKLKVPGDTYDYRHE